ncbi:MAG: metallophosphoesterase [Kiritimatiellaeota bacterium]|nr:metallophosphoesterase [Kiritimatiellota bacterium]
MRRLVLLGVVAWAGFAPAQMELRVRPFVQIVGDNQMGVSWLVSGNAFGEARWRQQGEEWLKAYYAVDGLREANTPIQRARISGYDPALPLDIQTVSMEMRSFGVYRAPAYGKTVTSQPARVSALVSAEGETSFAVFTDVHSRTNCYPLLLPKLGEGLRFIVLAGDNLNDPPTEQKAVEDLFGPMAWFTEQGFACLFMRGNHETRGAFARHLRNYLVLPDDRYYGAMTLGPLRLVWLDCGEDKVDGHKEYYGLNDFEPYMGAQLEWLKREVQGEAFIRAQWRVVVVHIPPKWREGREWEGTYRMNAEFAPVLNRAGATAMICGHTHKPELQPPSEKEDYGFRGPVFIGGSWPAEKQVITRVDVRRDQLKITMIRADGSVFAEQTWPRK